jgi:hypothetical protein
MNHETEDHQNAQGEKQPSPQIWQGKRIQHGLDEAWL